MFKQYLNGVRTPFEHRLNAFIRLEPSLPHLFFLNLQAEKKHDQ